MPKICVQSQGKQFRVTIPRKLAIALDLKKGENVTFEINSKGRLELLKGV